MYGAGGGASGGTSGGSHDEWGNGCPNNGTPTPGRPGSGCGGGGGLRNDSSAVGGAGGTGTVIIRYAGLTTFMTMAYIIALNPNLLTNFAVGTPLWNGVFLATCIASAIGTICMAFMANKPFVMAPGMGLNSFFAVVVANIAVINNCEYESAFQAGLVIILVEGIVFLVLTLLRVREKIVEAIPLGVRYGIAPAIGLMLMNIGLGSNVGKNLEVLDKIVKDGKCTGVTHFTCIGNTKEGIKEQLQTYLDHGINHMLALRGDLPFGWTGTGGDLHYATELVKFVRQEFGDKFTIAVAGSPEGHIACRSLEADIAFLKQKQDNGADYIMTQLCWDMDQFRYWLDAIRAAGIWLPVDVGIMPILDQAATINMALSRNGCSLACPGKVMLLPFPRNWGFLWRLLRMQKVI